MSENSLWNNMRKKMIPLYWREATRHEDAYQRGIADVSFVQKETYRVSVAPFSKEIGAHGWMELKWVGMAPIRISTAVRIPHYTQEQKDWLKAKGEAGGMTFLFLQLGRAYFLFDHVTCQDVGTLTAQQLLDTANWSSHAGLDPRGLWEAINESG